MPMRFIVIGLVVVLCAAWTFQSMTTQASTQPVSNAGPMRSMPGEAIAPVKPATGQTAMAVASPYPTESGSASVGTRSPRRSATSPPRIRLATSSLPPTVIAPFTMGATASARPYVGLAATRAWIIIIDGPRRSETWDLAGRPHIPHQVALAAKGAIYHDFRNDGVTLTNPGHAAMTTGRWLDVTNDTHGAVPLPGFLQRFRKERGAPPEAARLITSKEKLHIIGDTTDPQWQGQFLPLLNCGEERKGRKGGRGDAQTLEAVLEAIRSPMPPVAMLVQFSSPDLQGHANNWDGYLAAIRETDAAMETIWNAVQADPRLRDSTTIFITNDHGRHPDGHLDGFISHGDDCEGCRAITLLVLGPDIVPGTVISKRRSQVDIAVTTAAILGIELPGTQGQRMDELFPRLPTSR